MRGGRSAALGEHFVDGPLALLEQLDQRGQRWPVLRQPVRLPAAGRARHDLARCLPRRLLLSVGEHPPAFPSRAGGATDFPIHLGQPRVLSPHGQERRRTRTAARPPRAATPRPLRGRVPPAKTSACWRWRTPTPHLGWPHSSGQQQRARQGATGLGIAQDALPGGLQLSDRRQALGSSPGTAGLDSLRAASRQRPGRRLSRVQSALRGSVALVLPPAAPKAASGLEFADAARVRSWGAGPWPVGPADRAKHLPNSGAARSNQGYRAASRVRYYQIPSSFHHSAPTVHHTRMFQMATKKPARHHSPNVA